MKDCNLGKVFNKFLISLIFCSLSIQASMAEVNNIRIRQIDYVMSQPHNIESMGGGGAIILFDKTGIIMSKAYGDFTLDTVVPIASASKWIAGATIMKLADLGYYNIHDNVQKYYPEYVPVESNKGEMTIAQLFSHTGGLFQTPNYHRLHQLPSIDKAVELILRDVSQDFLPGTTIHYAGVGMQIGGGIAEKVTGESWHDIFKNYVTKPLGMNNTDYLGYISGTVTETNNPGVGGSIRTSANDYFKLIKMLYLNGYHKGNKFFSNNAMKDMMANYSPGFTVSRTPLDPYTSPSLPLEKLETTFGGWILQEQGETKFVTSPGAWGAFPFIDYENDIAGIYLPYQTVAEYDNNTGLNKNDASVLFYEKILPLIRNMKK